MVPASVQQDGVDRYSAPAEWLAKQKFKTKRAASALEAGRVQNAVPVADQMAKIKASKGRK
jgi:hypothetical protein